MIRVESRIKSVDNAGGIVFKCIRVFGGFKRRFARLGDVVGTVSSIRRVYSNDLPKKVLAKKVKKKRKDKTKPRKSKYAKEKKNVKPYIKPYLGLLINTRSITGRPDGSYVKFDRNAMITFTGAKEFGPTGKSTGELVFAGTRFFSPLCSEAFGSKKVKDKFKAITEKRSIVV